MNDIDIVQQGKTIMEILLPYLPFLIEGGKLAGKKAIEKIGAEAGEELWNSAKILWGKLKGRGNVEAVAETVVKVPENEALQEALAQEIIKVLENEPSLLEETSRIVSEVETGDVGKGGKVIGVKVKGGSSQPVDIESKVKTGNVEGEVTGVDVEV